MKTGMIVAAAAAAAAVCGLLGAGYYVFRVACRRARELPWEDGAALQSTAWAPMADRIQEGFAWLKRHRAQEVWVTSDDGLKLRAQWVGAVDAAGTIILMHGYRSCPQADFSMVLDFYHKLGFNLLLPDQRSCGKSEGKYITFGVLERLDLLRWIQWHNATVGKQDLFLTGMSMGASTVLMASGEDLPENVRGIVADCGFTSPWDIICRQVRYQLHIAPEPLVWCAGLFARMLGKFDLRRVSTVKAVQRCTVPVLLVHGTGDRYVPCEMTKAAYAACPGEKQLILVEGAGHGLSYVVDQPRCQSALENFFMEHLSRKK